MTEPLDLNSPERDEVDELLSGVSNESKRGGKEELPPSVGGGEGARRHMERATFSVRCTVCDSSLSVTFGQVGKEVKCNDCFSMIKVRPPTAKEKEQIENQVHLLEAQSDSNDPAPEDDGELKLAPLDDEEVEVVAESVADDDDQPLTLRDEPVTDLEEVPNDDFADVLLDAEEEDDPVEDLLSEDLPLPDPIGLEDTDFGDAAMLAAAAKKSKDKGKQKEKSKGGAGERPLNPYRSKSAQQAKVREKGFKSKPKKSDVSASKFPEVRFDAFFSAAVEMVTQPSVVVRGLIAAALMAIGNVIAHAALATYSAIEAPTMGDTATMGFWRLGIGWLPYALGTILLWYFCGVIFREAAGGQKKIKSWKLGPSTEWSSTLLITAVSFAIAGSPAMMLMSIYITAPVRFLLALPFLTAVWYVQSPFAIISSDVVIHLRNNGKQWATVFLVVLALASIAFVAGVLMHIPVPWLNSLTSTLGAIFLSFVTLAFAAVAGWHSGMVVEQLN